mgnify:FL=1
MLSTHQLNITLNKQSILKHISLTVEPRTITAILGPNGAGKSTLMKTLCGDITAGLEQVELEGLGLHTYSSLELSNLRSVMPQSIQLDFPFLVSEVIEMSLVQPIQTDEKAIYIERALSLFNVSHLHDRNYLTLSGGEQQRVQLARVVAQVTRNQDDQQRYLFLDECTSSLDLAHQHQVFEVIQSIVQSHNIAVIMVLHDLNLAAQYADRLVLMKQGRIVNNGSVNEVLQENTINRVYEYPVQIMPHPKGWPMVIPA